MWFMMWHTYSLVKSARRVLFTNEIKKKRGANSTESTRRIRQHARHKNRDLHNMTHHEALTYPNETAKLGTPENIVPLYMIVSAKLMDRPSMEKITSPRWLSCSLTCRHE
jgi:hypothetical protein